MDYRIWMPYYLEISKDLRIDPEKDISAGRLLSGMLSSNPLLRDPDIVRETARSLFENRNVYVLGAGPDLEMELDLLISEKMASGRWKVGNHGEDVLVTADGATSILMARGYTPSVIVTDLDGGVEDQLTCLTKGALMFVHAHADNTARLMEVCPRLHGMVIGTTQVDPVQAGGLDNYGGFSDGDRAAFISQHYGCRSITLLGFDFNEVGEKLTGHGVRVPTSEMDMERKFKKLAWASVLLGLITSPQVRFFSQDRFG